MASSPFPTMAAQLFSVNHHVTQVQSVPIESPPGTAGVHAFFTTFFNTLVNDPERAGVPAVGPFQLANGEMTSKNPELGNLLARVHRPVADLLELLYDITSTGTLQGSRISLEYNLETRYLRKQKTVRKNLLLFVSSLGMQIEQEDGHVVLTVQDQDVARALQSFGIACRTKLPSIGEVYFTHCCLTVLRDDFSFDPTELLSVVAPAGHLQTVIDFHRRLIDRGYACDIKADSFGTAMVFAYTRRKIKSSPLVEIQHDARFLNRLRLTIKFKAMSTIAPIVHRAPMKLQDDLFEHSNACGSCGWCKNHKGLLKPSVLKVADRKKTICWYNSRDFSRFDPDEIELAWGYVDLHEQLVG